MKKIGLLLVLALCTAIPAAVAQAVSFYGGYNFAPGAYSSIDRFADNYNKYPQRTIKTPMDGVGGMRGMALGFGYYGGVYIEAEWTGRHASTYAVVSRDNEPDVRRDLRVRNNAVTITLGGCGGEDKVAAGFGMHMEIVDVKTFSRVYPLDGSEVPDYEDPVGYTDLNVGFGPSAFIFIALGEPFALGIRPYYTFYVFKQDFNEENEKFNYIGPNYDYVEQPELKARFNHFGIQLRLGLVSIE